MFWKDCSTDTKISPSRPTFRRPELKCAADPVNWQASQRANVRNRRHTAQASFLRRFATLHRYSPPFRTRLPPVFTTSFPTSVGPSRYYHSRYAVDTHPGPREISTFEFVFSVRRALRTYVGATYPIRALAHRDGRANLKRGFVSPGATFCVLAKRAARACGWACGLTDVPGTLWSTRTWHPASDDARALFDATSRNHLASFRRLAPAAKRGALIHNVRSAVFCGPFALKKHRVPWCSRQLAGALSGSNCTLSASKLAATRD